MNLKTLLKPAFIIFIIILSMNVNYAEDDKQIDNKEHSIINYQTIDELNNRASNKIKIKTKTIMIPIGIDVPFYVDRVYTSDEITNSTKINAVIANDIYYDKYLIFKKGTIGYLYPSNVNKAGRFGNNGKIKIESAFFKDIDNNEQLISLQYETQGKKVVYDFSAGFFSKSKNAEIGPGNLMIGKTVNTFPIKILCEENE